MMKKLFISIILFLFVAPHLRAQRYQVTTQRTDPFSVALVQLLNCGINRFDSCKGEYFQTTMMSQTEHHLTIKFPNSIAGIVRSADWDKNAYVEFGPYKDRYEMAKALKELKQKIKNALGTQLFDDARADSLLYYNMSIADAKGRFESSFELFTGTTREKSYLLTPTINTVDKTKPEHNFILLKVEGRIPAYYQYIPNDLKPADDSLHLTLKQLILWSLTDFKNLPPGDTAFKRKRQRVLRMNGLDVIYKPWGGNRSASINIPVSTDSATRQKQWEYYQLIMQAAAGSDYIYHAATLDTWQYIAYFNKNYDQKQPRLYLQLTNPYIEFEVQSTTSHPVKRSHSYSHDDEIE